jgi:hypothetical protein
MMELILTPKKGDNVAVDVKAVVEQLKTILVSTKARIADNDGWDVGDAADVFEAIVLVATAVDQFASEFGALTSDEKKQVAVDTLDSLIDVPIVPDWLERATFGVLFDLTIFILNKFVGVDWAQRMARII